MFVRSWVRGGTTYAAVVENKREGKKVVQKTVLYIGAVDPSQVPYLKAAWSDKKPALVYEDGTVYRP